MDCIKSQKQQTVIEFNKYQLLKKALQFLLSFSVISFLFYYSSSFPFLVCSFNFYFSSFSFQLFDQTIDRKYMFLLCNLILVFLAGNSGLISSSPLETADFHDEFHKRNRDDRQGKFELSEKKASASEEEVVLGIVETSVNGNGCLIAVGGETDFLTAAATEEEEEEEEEENALLTGNSGLISSSPSETADFHDEFHKRNRDDLQGKFELADKKASASEEEVVLGIVETSENGNGCLIAVGGETGFVTAVLGCVFNSVLTREFVSISSPSRRYDELREDPDPDLL
ncbi:hypothetical protein NE237_001031 [Protea cynaroides]|uniref:Uncharacterized protein n=1 Tax=Protea cynaroides TaxID=273540 RepID=A0A9Q0QXP6_9MAGN|nr:hypothetical protein NE237_001031 [Protea cynaroides]